MDGMSSSDSELSVHIGYMVKLSHTESPASDNHGLRSLFSKDGSRLGTLGTICADMPRTRTMSGVNGRTMPDRKFNYGDERKINSRGGKKTLSK